MMDSVIPFCERAAEARNWFEDPELWVVATDFERSYRRLPHQLHFEIALCKLGHVPRRICVTSVRDGQALAPVAERLPGVILRAREPFPAFLPQARAALPTNVSIECGWPHEQDTECEPFDLICGYSDMRLWPELAAGLTRVKSLLAPNGMAYFQDFRADMSEAIRRELISSIPDPHQREFFAVQANAALPAGVVTNALRTAGFKTWSLSWGGLGGAPARSAAALSMIQCSPELARLLFQLQSFGFRRASAAELMFHLFVFGDGRKPNEANC
ncbi:hypothetical protein [Rhizobium jaguaris]|uniref:hypothetical protein n=1 Tax=Rhizobium jaguaris TaxID=1312183 RepID=UPI0013C4DE26|nr:hypothetical protein [Rhizobium jaguaris]